MKRAMTMAWPGMSTVPVERRGRPGDKIQERSHRVGVGREREDLGIPPRCLDQEVQWAKAPFTKVEAGSLGGGRCVESCFDHGNLAASMAACP